MKISDNTNNTSDISNVDGVDADGIATWEAELEAEGFSIQISQSVDPNSNGLSLTMIDSNGELQIVEISDVDGDGDIDSKDIVRALEAKTGIAVDGDLTKEDKEKIFGNQWGHIDAMISKQLWNNSSEGNIEFGVDDIGIEDGIDYGKDSIVKLAMALGLDETEAEEFVELIFDGSDTISGENLKAKLKELAGYDEKITTSELKASDNSEES